MRKQTRRYKWAVQIALLIALATTLTGCFDFSEQKTDEQTFESPLETSTAPVEPLPTLAVTPTTEPGVIVITPGQDRREPTWTPWPTSTPQPTPTHKPGSTSTPFPIQEPATNASGSIYYAVNMTSSVPDNVSGFYPDQVVYRLPIDGTGLAAGAPTTLTLPQEYRFDSVSPNGRYMLLLEPSEPGGVPHILDVNTGDIWSLFKEYPWAGGRAFAWHPNGHQVLFWSLDVALWLVDANTGEYTVLAVPDGPIQGATISPDGQKVVYVTSSSLSERTFEMTSAFGGTSQTLFVQNGPGQIFNWSPTGNYILYAGTGLEMENTSDKSTSTAALWLMNTNDYRQKLLNIPFLFGWSFTPVWSPDGQHIAAVAASPDRDFACIEQKGLETNWENCWYQGTSIYLENVSTGQTHHLTQGITPVWSPNGKKIAFLSNQSGASEVWIVDVQDGSLHQLTSDDQPKIHTLVWTKE